MALAFATSVGVACADDPASTPGGSGGKGGKGGTSNSGGTAGSSSTGGSAGKGGTGGKGGNGGTNADGGTNSDGGTNNAGGSGGDVNGGMGGEAALGGMGGDDGSGGTDSSGGTGGTDASGGTGGTGGTDASGGTGGTGGTDASGGTGGTDASGGTGGTDASGGTGGTDASGGTGGTDASGGTGGTGPAPCGGCAVLSVPIAASGNYTSQIWFNTLVDVSTTAGATVTVRLRIAEGNTGALQVYAQSQVGSSFSVSSAGYGWNPIAGLADGQWHDIVVSLKGPATGYDETALRKIAIQLNAPFTSAVVVEIDSVTFNVAGVGPFNFDSNYDPISPSGSTNPTLSFKP